MEIPGKRFIRWLLNAVGNDARRVDEMQGESCPIQDEPEGEVGFQYKMSLKRMAC
jgi:hypothetical protein